MTSDERHAITELDQPSGLDAETRLEPEADMVEATDWDLEAEPIGRTLAPAAEGPAAGVSYVEFPVRAAAFALDAVLLIVISDYASRAVYTFIFSGILGPSVALGPAYQVLYLAVVAAVFAIIAVQALVVTYVVRVFRATPGQMAFGLFTLGRRNGRAMTGSAAFVRWLVLFAPLAMLVLGPLVITVLSQYMSFGGQSLPDWFALVSTVTQLAPVAWFVVLIASVLLDERGRGLHDQLSGSVVVRRDGPPS